MRIQATDSATPAPPSGLSRPWGGRGLIVDLFAGGGGASTGIEAALGRAVTIAINHDPVALAVHKARTSATCQGAGCRGGSRGPAGGKVRCAGCTERQRVRELKVAERIAGAA